MADSRVLRVGCLWLLSACVPALAQTTNAGNLSPETIEGASPAATDTQISRVAQRFVNEKLALWQQRLKLDNWKISAVLAHRDDLPPKTLGGIHWDKAKRSAVIMVLDPAEYRLPIAQVLDDMELTVIHELVHLDLTSLPRGQASRGSEERAVNGIAQAMLGLERQK